VPPLKVGTRTNINLQHQPIAAPPMELK